MPIPRILLLTSELIGPRLAGQAMRVWEISRVLASHCEIVLVAAHLEPVEAPGFRLVAYSPEAFAGLERWADAVVLTEGTLRVYPRVGRLQKPIAIDLACPSLVESLELTRQWEEPDPWGQTLRRQLELGDRLEPFRRGDFFFCGSPRQRDFYLGILGALGRINPLTYNNDLQLDRLIAVVPFGLPAEPPRRTRTVLRGVLPGIGSDDFILIWAGGVWAWFDPWTLLEAMRLLRDSLPRVKLYFMGITPPHPQLRWFSFNDLLMTRARELGVLDQNVFVNTEWIEYDQRADYLLEADAGVTTQAEHLETHLAVRTRAFDYAWARLPLITTRGDWIAELAEQKGLGLTVPAGDVAALAGAIRRLSEDEALRRQMRERMDRQACDWAWERVCEPLVRFCREPRFAADRPFQRAIQGKPRWSLQALYRWHILKTGGILELLRSLRFLMPIRQVRVAFRDEGIRAGFRALRGFLRPR